MTSNIIVTEAGRAWSSGTAEINGRSVRWEAYRKNESEIRVMLAEGKKWLQGLSAARNEISPTARKAMRP
jgi:hypothetical protein